MSKRVERKLVRSIMILGLLAVISCQSPNHPVGLAEAGGGAGPMIIFDPLAKPIPEIPFPNDLGTTMDESTVTGRRLNFPIQASTQLEREVRAGLNGLDGFGTFATIYLRFDAPLDLNTVSDATVMLVKLLPPNAGKVIPVDLGKGFFPTLTRPEFYWPHDPLADETGMLFDPENKFDYDGDGLAETFVDFYEVETNTLLIRPILPMDEASRYAVVITRGVQGMSGEPVRSPFKYINHTMQTNDLSTLPGILAGMGIPLSDVAFTWSFTTQSITPDWNNIIQGVMYGTGPLGYINTAFPPILEPTDLQLASDGDGNSYTLAASWFGPLLSVILPFTGQNIPPSVLDFRYVDYFLFGTLKSPSFFPSLDFGNPLIAHEIHYDEAMLAGLVPANTAIATWVLTIPKDEDMGLDGCQTVAHPQGCADWEETGATGADGLFGIANFDDNGDTLPDDRGEYLSPGSDDIADPAADNYDPGSNPLGTQGNGVMDRDFGANGVPGCVGDDDGNTIIDDITEFGRSGCDDGLTEDANRDGRLNTPPFPVALYGHGHGLAAIESLGFMGPISQYGVALLAMDAFGEGPINEFAQLDKIILEFLVDSGIPLDEVCDKNALSANCNTIVGILTVVNADLNGDGLVNLDDIHGLTINDIVSQMFNIGLFKVLARQGRAYDTDGDTYPNSGGVNFTANIFQTRDIVRQTATDYMQLARAVDYMGVIMFDFDGDTVLDINGDYNHDGQYDIGGPTNINTRGHFYLGSSLGGINGAVSVGVNPRIVAAAPVSGAGGLTDVIGRSSEREATEPIMRQSAGIVVVGDFDGVPGRATITFNEDPPEQAVGYLYLPPYGRVQVTNLVNGEVEVVTADEDGNFSIGVPADVGDTIQVLSLDDVSGPNQSVVLATAKYHGLGAHRNSPDYRRLMALAQIIIERGDPINLAPHYFTNEMGSPLPGVPEKGVLVISTVGDGLVPVSTANQIALAAGLLTMEDAQVMIDNGLNLGWVPEAGMTSPSYDPEDLDDDGLECGHLLTNPLCNPLDPGIAPVPDASPAGSNKKSAYRIQFPDAESHHAFALPGNRNVGIDWGIYMLNQIGYFFASDGTCIIDDPWELHSVPVISPGPDGILQTIPAGDDTTHTIRILTTLGFNPCDYDFPTVQVIGTGPNFVINSAPLGDDVSVPYDSLYRGP